MFRKKYRFLFAVCSVVCNNFPRPSPTEEQKQKIEVAQPTENVGIVFLAAGRYPPPPSRFAPL